MDDCVEMQTALVDTKTIDEFLHELALIASRQIGAESSCGMAIKPNGRPPAMACSDQLAERVDAVQFRIDDGPCLRALRAGEVVTIADTAEEARWPEFEAEAVAAGVRSCLAVPLRPEPATAKRQPIGALSMYSRSPEAFGEMEIQRAEEFAKIAYGALMVARRLASYADLNEQLRASIASRSVIDQAIGIIMARGGLGSGKRGDGSRPTTQARAFEILRATSQNTNTKLRDVARGIVSSTTGEPVQDPTPFEDPPPSFGDPSASPAVG
jgi:GAF domain-containing protein